LKELALACGIDIGTSAIKAVVVNPYGEIKRAYHQSYQPAISEGGTHELIINDVLKALKNVWNSIHTEHQIGVIGLGSAMHSLILLGENYQPLTNCITWADQRSSKIANELSKSLLGKEIYQLTGTPIHAMTPLCKIKWFQVNQVEVFGQAQYFVGIKSYLIHLFSGQLVQDYSLASATGMLNRFNLDWEEKCLNYCGINKEQLPRLVDTNHQINFSKKVKLGHEVPVIIGASDGCLANLDSYSLNQDCSTMTIGTSAAIRKTVPFNPKVLTGNVFCYYLDKRLRIVGGPSNSGGGVIDYFIRLLGYAGPKDFFYDIKNVQPGAKGLLYLPWLYGERAPIWDAGISSSFIGIKSHHTRAHMAKAVMEGIAYNLKWIMQELEESTKKPIDEIKLSGGLSSSAIAAQGIADILGKQIFVTQKEDSSARGAAIIGMHAMALIDDYALPFSSDQQIMRYHPQEHTAELHNNRLGIFKALHSAMKNYLHKL